MNYQKIYDSIINRAKNRKLDEYCENHHIIPKSIGGSDNKENIVRLKYREHFLVHKLLVEIYPDSKELKYAIWMMCITTLNSKNEEYIKEKDSLNRVLQRNFEQFKISQRDYERYKKLYIKSKKGKKYSDQERKNVSDGTKRAMQDHERVLKRRKGVLGTKFYYDIETKQSFKWFPGDPEPDMTKYSWGRGKSISTESKEKLNNLKNLGRKSIWNDKIGVKMVVIKDYIKNLRDDWSSQRCSMNVYSKIVSITNLNRELLRDIHFGLVKRGEFIDNILFVKVREFTSKTAKFWTIGFLEECGPLIKKWVYERDTIIEKEQFMNEFVNFIIDHKKQIYDRNKQIYFEYPNFE